VRFQYCNNYQKFCSEWKPNKHDGKSVVSTLKNQHCTIMAVYRNPVSNITVVIWTDRASNNGRSVL